MFHCHNYFSASFLIIEALVLGLLDGATKCLCGLSYFKFRRWLFVNDVNVPLLSHEVIDTSTLSEQIFENESTFLFLLKQSSEYIV